MDYQAVIGLEVHAELETRSKMFCACPVVDTTQALPNSAVCPVCAGMPGVLPVVNRQAVEFALQVALALKCEIAPISIFARKNYFYPDLPKGYQISQYEQPLARHGQLTILTSRGERLIHIRRVHLEEDTGKLTHVNRAGQSYSLVDLNRAGVPLLEIVTEPDLHTAEEVRAYAVALRNVLCYLGANSGDLEKGVMRVEPNISVRPVGSSLLGTRVEIKNLNSFRALERSVAFEIQRQIKLRNEGKNIVQETVGWDDPQGITFTQRVKETEDDYRYFPEPDLPPLMVEPAWVERLRASLPELPFEKSLRFQQQYHLSAYDAGVLASEKTVADYFEQSVQAAPTLPAKVLANWIHGELFGLLNQAGINMHQIHLAPQDLAELVSMVVSGDVNQNTGKLVLREMFSTGKSAKTIVFERLLGQISDIGTIRQLVEGILSDHPQQVSEYLAGKETISRWLFGQVMSASKGQAHPQIVRGELERQLAALRSKQR